MDKLIFETKEFLEDIDEQLDMFANVNDTEEIPGNNAMGIEEEKYSDQSLLIISDNDEDDSIKHTDYGNFHFEVLDDQLLELTQK